LYLERRSRIARDLGLEEERERDDATPAEERGIVIEGQRVEELTDLLRWRRRSREEDQAAQAEEALRAEADEPASMEAGSGEGVAASGPRTNGPAPAGGAWAGGPRSDRDTRASDPAPDGHEWPTAPPSNGDAWLDLRQRTFAPMQAWMGAPPRRRAG
ncbi:MAG: hypothetical protein V3U11_11385, partial [Planctomycetota bacterium]